MPLYEYRCECGNERAELHSFEEYDQPQICGCGKAMHIKVSLSSFAIKQTGNNMALATLNAPKGQGMPDRHWKPDAERKAFVGTQRKQKTVW